jgi:hypothetical protein
MSTLEKHYPNSPQGAIQCLKETSTLNTRGAKAIRDPSVEGVWKVNLPAEQADEDSLTVAAIVYLAGYKTPWGVSREMNDFETLMED